MFEVVPTAFQVVPIAPYHLVDGPPLERMLQFCNKMGVIEYSVLRGVDHAYSV